MQPLVSVCKRVVVKIGSSLLYAKDKLDLSRAEGICGQVADLASQKKEVLLVSSGAIACGMGLLGLKSRPKDLSRLQAVAAVGQNELMDSYRRFFKKTGFHCGQVLLTREDFGERRRYLNARNTLVRLLELPAIPVINENDTVATDEIKFGDNDQLSALVAGLVDADILIILSDVDGLLDKDKKTVIRVVDEITPQIRALAQTTEKKTSVGGMITKLEAVKICADSGIPCVIANGSNPGIILRVISSPASSGTLFLPKKTSLDARRRWLAFGSRPSAKIMVDQGAKQALLNKKSLLSVGVADIEGEFEKDEIVFLADYAGSAFAKGRTNISSEALEKIKGKRSAKEVIHCDNIVIL